MSSSSSRSSSWEERIAMWEAEDGAHRLIKQLPEDGAVVTAVKVALDLDELWQIEAEEMIGGGDDRYVYKTTREERCWLDAAGRACAKDPHWWHCPSGQVRSLFAKLPPDVAAFVSYNVARSICSGKKFG